MNQEVIGGVPVLLLASGRGLKDITTLMIEKGANVSATDAYLDTALHVTARNSRRNNIYAQKEVARILIARGADLEARNAYNKTPYDLAKDEQSEIQYLYSFV